MKRKRFSVEQIVGVLKQAEVGVPVAELIRKVGISEQTFYRWKKHYTGLEVDQVRQLKQLQEENARLKRLVADLTLDEVMLQDVLGKNSEALAAASGGRASVSELWGQRAKGLQGGSSEPGDVPVSQPQGSTDRIADAHPGDRSDPSSIRIPEDPGAAEPRGLGSGKISGLLTL